MRFQKILLIKPIVVVIHEQVDRGNGFGLRTKTGKERLLKERNAVGKPWLTVTVIHKGAASPFLNLKAEANNNDVLRGLADGHGGNEDCY